MITNYIKPQLLIRQLLEVLPAITEPSLNAFVYGPQYKLNRYAEPSEKANMNGTKFAVLDVGETQTVPYEGLTDKDNVDLDFVKLYAENMEMSVAYFPQTGTGNRFFYNDALRPNELVCYEDGGHTTQVETNIYDTADLTNTLATELNGRPVKIGDLVVTTDDNNNTTTKRKIVDIKKSTEESYTEDPECATSNIVDTTDVAEVVGSVDFNFVDNSILLSAIAVTSNNTITTNVPFAAAGSSFGGKLAERFTVFGTKAGTGTGANAGQCRVRTVSDNFEKDEVDVEIIGGDTVITIPDTGVVVTITGLTSWAIGDAISWTTQAAYTAIKCGSAGAGSHTVVGGKYQHAIDTNVVLECLVGGAAASSSWRLSDTAGVEDSLTKTGAELAAGVAFGQSGVNLTVTKTLQAAGDTVTVKCVAKGRTGLYSVIVLSAPAGDPTTLDSLDSSQLDVEIRKVYDGLIPKRGKNAPVDQWAATEDGIVLQPDLAFIDWGYDSGDGSALLSFVSEHTTNPRLFASYRELVPAAADEKIVKVTKASQLTQFGDKDLDNPLGFGASAAIAGSQGKPIYVGRVRTNDATGFNGLLKKAENIDFLYAHAPMTDDLTIQLTVRDHCELMSNEQNKKWRRAYVSTPVPGDYRVLGDPDEGATSATVTSDGDGNVIVNDPDGKFVQAKVRSGDQFKINFSSNAWGDPTYDKQSEGGYLVEEVLDEENLILASGPASAMTVPRRYEIWKKDDGDGISLFMAARSSSIGSRRMNNIFSDGAQYLTDEGEFVSIHPMFLAAEIAGLRSAVLPQQGLTNTEIALVSSAEAMFVKYSTEQLDLIAANGSFIIAQEYEDGPRFIRHQLTTKSDLGNLYYEDSVGVNVDEISFQVKSALRPYIGRRNTNPQTVRDIFDDMFDLLSDSTVDPGFGNSIGPALIGFTDLVVGIDETYKDRINVSAKLEVPLPLNVIDVTLHATASFNEGELTLESLGISRVGTTVDQLDSALFDLDGNAIDAKGTITI